ncbi:DoxX family protein [Streptomyces sp. NPDC052052]|uniref:DoxX family protein n=1 Tax=Streptomyces sp. NPDC052052 TaxID=3154756 RepID=UPI00343ABE2D
MNVALWIVAGALAVMFAVAGVMKSIQSKEELAQKLPWVEDVSTGALRLVGVAELLGALGLILPAWTGIAPVLAPTAAVGLAVIMALAIGTHVRRRESSAVVVNLVLLATAVFVAWGRFGPYSY